MKSCHCDNMDGHRGYYAKWNNSDKDKTVWFHLYVESTRLQINKQLDRNSLGYREYTGSCQRRGV